jgi:hypothetical protein
MHSEQTAPAGAISQDFGDYPSHFIERQARQERQDEAIRMALSRRVRARLDREFANPIKPADMARVMCCWVSMRTPVDMLPVPGRTDPADSGAIAGAECVRTLYA